MSTEQSYVGGGSNATNPTETANSGPKITPTADNRSAEKSGQIAADRAFYQTQTKLLQLVDEYMSLGGAAEPIEVINELLYDWLTLPTTNLVDFPKNQSKLFAAFQVVNFLAKSYEQLNDLQRLEAKQKEVGGE